MVVLKFQLPFVIPGMLDWAVLTEHFCLQAGVFVLDPMCGLGTILLEAAKEWPVSPNPW